MFSRPRWYIVYAALAVAVVGMLASVAIPLSADRQASQVRLAAVGDDSEQQIIERLDKLTERIDRLEGRLGERSGVREDAARAYVDALQKSRESDSQDDMDSVRESMEALRKSLDFQYGDPSDLRRFKILPETVLQYSGPGIGFALHSGAFTELKEILQGLTKEHRRVEFTLKDGEWKIDMKGKLDSETKKRIDKAVDKLKAGSDKVEVQCTVDEDGSCSLSVSTGDADGPAISTRIYSDTGDGIGDMWERCVPKPMPKELREKLRDLNKERQEKIKHLLKEYGYEEKDFPTLGFGFGCDDDSASMPFAYRLFGDDSDGIGLFFDGPNSHCPWFDDDNESDESDE